MPVVGRIVALRVDARGRWATVSFRGALREVAIDLVPDAGPGVFVVIEAGVALARVEEPTAEGQACASRFPVVS